jgi:PEP-CTERM motif
MVSNFTAFKGMVLSVLTVGALFVATSARAQVISGLLTTPGAATFGAGVTVTSGIGNLVATPFALPSFGAPLAIQFTSAGDIFKFNNLPATGSGSVGSLTTIISLVIDPGATAIGPLNFNTTYSYDADTTVAGTPGTRVTFSTSGFQDFAFGGSTYRVEVLAADPGVAGAPSTISTNTLTGRITNLTSGVTAPEPGTLVLAGLGIAGLAVRRRRK